MIVYKSNGQVIGDGVRVTRVSNGGQKLEVMTDTKAETYSEVVLKDDAPADPIDPDPVGGGDDTLTGPVDTLPGGGGSDTVSGGGGGQPPASGAFDLFVAAWGNDASPGTAAQPYATVARANMAAKAGDSIGIAAGLWEGRIDGKAGVSYGGWGGVATFTGGVALTGGVPCDASDAADLGGVRPDVLKFTGIPLSAFPSSDPRAAIPTEGGAPLALASLKAPNPKHPLSEVYPDDMLDGVPILTGTTVKGFSHPALVGVPSSQVMQARVEFIGNPNQNYQSAVAAHDPASGTISLAGGAQYENSAIRDKFALINFLPALAPGAWGYKITGTTATIYICPRGTGALRRAAFGNVIRSAGAGCAFRNIHVTHCADFGPKQNKMNPVVITHADCVVEDMAVTVCARGTIKGYGAIYWTGARPTLRRVRVEHARRTYGFFIHGTSPMSVAEPLIEDVTMRDVDGSPIQMFGTTAAVVGFADFEECGMEAHGNAINSYEGCGPVLFFGLRMRRVYGYITMQESGPHSFVASRIQVSNRGGTASGRAIVDQNRQPIPALPSYKGYMVQTTVFPHMPDAAKNNALGLGRKGLPLTYEVWDSVYHGAVASEPATGGNNVTTNGAAIVAGDRPMTLAQAYKDTADFALNDLGPGGDRSHVLAALQATFPRFTRWHEGIDWRNTRVGT